MDSRENAIQSAIQDLNSGIFFSQRAAAVAYSIPQSTLTTRLRGSKSKRLAHEKQQRMTSLQEEFLADWIIEEDTRGYPPSHARAREMASRVLRANGDTDSLGKKWISGFKQRNPRIASIVGKKMEACRIDNATPEQLHAFFNHLDCTRKRLNVRDENMWNMDETGIALGICANTLVLASSEKSHTYVKAPQDREWVSIIETISATDRKLRYLVIFKGGSL